MSAKPTYSIDAPDQARLKVARLEIEAVLKKHDLAGIVLLHTPGMTEFFYDIRPSYSCCWIDQDAQLLRLKSKQADYGGDLVRMAHDRAATANMTAGLAEDLREVARMFSGIDSIVRVACDATHTPRGFVPDPVEAKPQ